MSLKNYYKQGNLIIYGFLAFFGISFNIEKQIKNEINDYISEFDINRYKC